MAIDPMTKDKVMRPSLIDAAETDIATIKTTLYTPLSQGGN